MGFPHINHPCYPFWGILPAFSPQTFCRFTKGLVEACWWPTSQVAWLNKMEKLWILCVHYRSLLTEPLLHSNHPFRFRSGCVRTVSISSIHVYNGNFSWFYPETKRRWWQGVDDFPCAKLHRVDVVHPVVHSLLWFISLVLSTGLLLDTTLACLQGSLISLKPFGRFLPHDTQRNVLTDEVCPEVRSEQRSFGQIFCAQEWWMY